MKNWLRISALIVALSSSTACYGSFAATKGLHTWNGKVSGNKFVNTLVFWAFIILPVYGLFTLGDGIIFNVIEFWSGSNPLALEVKDNGDVRLANAGHELILRPTNEGRFDVFMDGQSAGVAELTADGGVSITDATRQRSFAISGADAQQLHDVLAPRFGVR